MLALATLGILIPFWFYNVFGNAQRGHKLFMGDTGSLTIGYILSFLVIQLSVVHSDGEVRTNPYMVIAFSTLLVPLLDVFRVVLHRLRKGRNPFLPDKNHIHHKLLRTGMRVRTDGPVNLLLFHRDEYPAVPGFKSYLVIGTKYVVVGIDTSYHQPVYHPLQGKK